MNHKKIYRKKGLVIGLLLLVAFCFAGCYSFEEKVLAAEYKKQAKVNAVNYIKEKYGFEAKVKSVWVQRLGEFDPFPNSDVFVTMKWADDEFVVRIAGDIETSDGFDNYQQEEILSALKDEMDTLTGIDSEEVFAGYGDYSDAAVGSKTLNGLVAPYFTGENLNEILTSGYARPEVMITYINQEIAGIDVEKIKEQTGIKQLLFVDYDSKEHYESIVQSEEGQIGDMNRNLPYINEYLEVEYEDTTYVNCQKKIVNGVLFVTESPSETVTVEKLSGFTRSFTQKDSRLVFDVYALETDADKVHVYVPAEALSEPGKKTPEFVIMKGFGKEYWRSDPTSDGKYVGTTFYMRNYEGACEFSMLVREE